MAVATADAATWWGSGAPPAERWPGVTIPIDDGGGKYRFDQALADRACAWFPKFCSHSKGKFAGQKFELLDYQRDLIIRPLFGWVRQSDGLRRFRKAFIEIPKKNGKTQLIAGLGLYMLLGDNEPGAEVYVGAADRDQARILFNAAKAMVEASPALSKRLLVLQNQIVRRDDPSAFFKVLSAEAATKHGLNIHCLILDELHAQPDRDLFETLTRGIIARRQPLIILITTAGDDDESICFEELDYAKGVLSGTIQDERHLPVIFEADPGEDAMAPATWRRVNPGLGTTISEEALADFALEAANEPRKRNDFLRYHLNRWVNSATAWIPIEWWDACEPTPPGDWREWLAAQTPTLKTLPVAAGLDLAQKWDLAAFVLAFRHRLPSAETLTVDAVDGVDEASAVTKTIDLNYRITLVPFFWIPEETMREHEQKDGVPYSLWQQMGLVTATEGVTIDYSRIYRDITTKILPLFPRLKQGVIGFDPAFATDVASQLRDRAGLKVLEVLQNYSHFSEICHVHEALVKAKRVSHGGHRILRNHQETVSVKTDDAKRMRPVRPKNPAKHIDGVVAALMAEKVLATLPDRPRSMGIQFWGGG